MIETLRRSSAKLPLLAPAVPAVSSSLGLLGSIGSALLFVLAGCGAPAGTAVAAEGLPIATAALPPAVELVESVPVETSLDHPELRDAAEVWVEMIEGAQRSIDLAQFYASNEPGSKLEGVVVALEAALGRGVHVRFLAEQKFVKLYPDTLDRLARGGAKVRHFDLSKVGGGILHAKYFVIDEREAFLGSQNFDWRALEHIYELGARVRQPAVVSALSTVFAADWAYAGGEVAPVAAAPAQPAEVALVASPQSRLPAGVAWDLPRLIALIDGAKTSVEVELLTYRADADGAPWEELEAPLVRAAARGVAVRLLLADWSKRKKTLAGLQRLARTSKIELRLISLPAWSGGFIPFARVAHAKLLVVDGAHGWLGTSNWERDYFYQSRNVGLLLEDRAVVAQLGAFFASAWQSQYTAAFDPAAAYEPPRVE